MSQEQGNLWSNEDEVRVEGIRRQFLRLRHVDVNSENVTLPPPPNQNLNDDFNANLPPVPQVPGVAPNQRRIALAGRGRGRGMPMGAALAAMSVHHRPALPPPTPGIRRRRNAMLDNGISLAHYRYREQLMDSDDSDEDNLPFGQFYDESWAEEPLLPESYRRIAASVASRIDAPTAPRSPDYRTRGSTSATTTDAKAEDNVVADPPDPRFRQVHVEITGGPKMIYLGNKGTHNLLPPAAAQPDWVEPWLRGNSIAVEKILDGLRLSGKGDKEGGEGDDKEESSDDDGTKKKSKGKR